MDLIKTGWTILTANLLKKYKPLSVYISVTDRCPHKCEYCNIPRRLLKELSTSEILKLIDEIAAAGAVRFQIVGGEPTLRKDLGDIIAHARRKKLYVTMSSTGWAVPEMIANLRDINQIFLSFDGPEEAHDMHKGKGAYQRLMRAMEALKKAGVKFNTTTLLTRKSVAHIDFVLAKAQELGFEVVFQALYYTQTTYKGHFHLPKVADSLVLSNQEYRNVFKDLLARKKAGAPIASSAKYLEQIIAWPDYTKIYSAAENPEYTCWAGRLYVYIDTNGLMYPCGDSIGVVEGMDALKMGFAEAYRKINLNRNCRSCIIACDLEKNLMFSLNLRTICNWIMKV